MITKSTNTRGRRNRSPVEGAPYDYHKFYDTTKQDESKIEQYMNLSETEKLKTLNNTLFESNLVK